MVFFLSQAQGQETQLLSTPRDGVGFSKPSQHTWTNTAALLSQTGQSAVLGLARSQLGPAAGPGAHLARPGLQPGQDEVAVWAVSSQGPRGGVFTLLSCFCCAKRAAVGPLGLGLALLWAPAVPSALGWLQVVISFTAFSGPEGGSQCHRLRVSVAQNEDLSSPE